jgi:hypothetical protein
LIELVKQIKAYYSATNNDGRVAYAAAAGTATKAGALAEPHTFQVSGDATAEAVSFDGSQNVNLKVTIANASTTAKGLMSKEDKVKLDGLANIKSVGDKLDVNAEGQLTVDLSTYATKDDITAVFKFKGSVAKVASLPTGATVGDVYHVMDTHSEYVWVDGNADDSEPAHKVAHWEELGLSTSLAGYASESWVTENFIGINGTISASKVEGLEAKIKETKVDAAVTADKVAYALTVVGPGNSTEHTYDGSEALKVDLSSIATSEAVAKKADKLTAAASGHILVGSADGGLADSGVAATQLSGGTITAGTDAAATDGRLVTGTVVKTYVDKQVGDAKGAAETAITAAINDLDVADITGDYLTVVGQTDGKIHATAGTKGTIAADSTGLVDGKTVYAAIASLDTAVGKIPTADIAGIVAGTTTE